MKIRAATPRDVEGIAQVHVGAWLETYPGLLPDAVIAARTLDQRRGIWAAQIARGAPVFVADQDGEVLGFGAGAPQRDARLAEMGYGFEILSLYTLHRAQRRGLGRGLMKAIFRMLRAGGDQGISVMVLKGNGPATTFYRALGGQFLFEAGDHLDDGTRVAHLAFGWPSGTELR